MTNFSDEEFLLRSRSISLESHHLGKNAEYHVQLVPAKRQQGSKVTWAVYAQYSRDSEPLKWVTKFLDFGYNKAMAAYAETLDTRFLHNYEKVPLAGSSVLEPDLSSVWTRRAAGLPRWPGFKDLFFSVSRELQEDFKGKFSQSFLTTVLLTDLSFPYAEGLTEAAPVLVDTPEPSRLWAALSDEVRSWASAYMAEHFDGDQNLAMAELHATCFRKVKLC
jgi:hypothetical protein